MGKIRVLIADDHPLIREGLRKVLSLEKEIQVIGEASDGHEVLKMVKVANPHVILMDLNMPRFSGAEAAKALLETDPETKIIALTVDDSEQRIVDLIKIGVAGYLLKDVSVDALVSTIKAVHAGETVITPRLTQLLLKEMGAAKTSVPSDLNGEELTARERDIIKLIAEGKNNREIARELFISEKTVKNHISSIFRKINVHDRTQAALYAIKANIKEM